MPFRQSVKHFLMHLSWIFILPSSGAYAYQTQLPDLGSPDLIEYDTQTEQRLGRAFSVALHTEFDLNYDPEILNYIRRIGERVITQTGDNRAFSFYVINNPSINAFAGPDGVIGIHTGLIEAVRSEDELASVIAHEVAHITQRHLSRQYEYQESEGSIASIASIIAAILVGTQDPNAGMAILMGGQGYVTQKQLSNSRQHEAEADFTGIKFLYKAGYNPKAMARFFGRLSRQSMSNSGQIPEILRTHPVTENRLAAAEDRAQTMPPFKPREDNGDLRLIQLRLQSRQKQELGKLFNEIPLNDDQRCYQLNDLDSNPADKNITKKLKNLQCLVKLAKSESKQPLYTDLLLEKLTGIINNSGLPKKDRTDWVSQTKEIANFAQILYPQRQDISIRYAEFLEAIGDSKQAKSLLLQHSSDHYNFLINQKLAEIANQNKDWGYAYFYQAQAQYNIGNIKYTAHLLKQAKEKNKNANNDLTTEITLFENQNRNQLNSVEKTEE
ncbi:M48 family metallopeptidase [Thiomicrorhabdus sp.]|uniref:M48 family metallopeptidase n=1 Tax=Thiomicrorhabdus sp. TaxID=2039724 RepID=UPI0029C90F59|nr:M48 family metalloprotease [Thiomicrorhabdus sp.]